MRIAPLIVLFAAQFAAAALTPQQQGLLNAADARLKQAQANLKAAEDAAGPATAKPAQSRANLALTRSASAKSQVATVKEALGRLPADDAAVKALADQATQTEQAIAALEARVTGTPAANAPAANPPAGNAPAVAGTKKLDFRQEKTLKDAEFYLREIEGLAGGAEEIAQQVKSAKNPEALDYRVVATGANSLTKAAERKKLVDTRLAELPADGVGVPQLAADLKAVTARLDAASAVITPVHEKLQKMVAPGAAPNFDADLKRLQEIGQMFNDPQILQRRFARAAEVVAQIAPARAEVTRFNAAYATLVQQQTDQGRRAEMMSRHVTGQLDAFVQAADAKTKSLPGEIRADLARCNELADQAVKEQKPAFFPNGIADQLGYAEQKLLLLAALNPAAAEASTKEIADTRAQLKQKQGSLREGIIAQNALPPDRYAGPDKAKLTEAAVAAWKAKQPDAQVLAVRFPSDAWHREAIWRWQNGWYLVDRSKLQAQVLVKHDEKLAVNRPIDLWIDHVSGDKLIATPMHADAKAEVEAMSLMLIEKVK